MQFLHYDVQLSSGESVRVDLDRQANVRLMDDYNFRRFQRGESCSFYGGGALKSPIFLQAPTSGSWHVVVDLGGYSGSVRAAATKIGRAAA